jgi:hypothetical protein
MTTDICELCSTQIEDQLPTNIHGHFYHWCKKCRQNPPEEKPAPPADWLPALLGRLRQTPPLREGLEWNVSEGDVVGLIQAGFTALQVEAMYRAFRRVQS